LCMCYHASGWRARPGFWEDIAMRFSSLFVASPAVAILSIELLLCGLSGTAMSQTATTSGRAAATLPGVVVEAPQTPKPRRVVHTVSPRTSPATPTPSASPMSPAGKLAKLASAAGSCVGGCVTSFRSGNAPWHGCSVSGWPAPSPTCRNVGNYKTYNECTEAGLVLGWRSGEVSWYCSSLALK
jgi:hypothetical protein